MLLYRDFKYICLQAYILLTLDEAQEQTNQGLGKVCCSDPTLVKKELGNIAERIRSKGYTYERLQEYALKNPFLTTYYNVISGTVGKYVKLGQGWIPALFSLSLLQEMTIQGYKGFEDIDFTKLIDTFIGFDGIDKDERKLHFECALEAFEKLNKVSYVKQMRRKKARK